jgi:multiple sugar transport system permease protein
MTIAADIPIHAVDAAAHEKQHDREVILQENSHKKKPFQASRVVTHVILALGAIIMAGPFIWMILSSFKPLGEIFIQPPRLRRTSRLASSTAPTSPSP